MTVIPSGGPGFGSVGKKNKFSKNPSMPDGSGFNRLVMKRTSRPDSKNLPGPTNHFGDRIGPGVRTNLQGGKGKAPAGSGLSGIMYRNPRAGQQYRTGMTSSGRTVHLYNSGERVVLPAKKAKFKRF